MTTAPERYVIGLTGNIATGKSTVAAMLQSLGAEVIDADKVAHSVMRPGTEVQQRVLERFGPTVFAPNGEIDRARLGAIVFADPKALYDLECLVHPAVIEETLRLLAGMRSRVRVIEAIKLLEARMHCYCQAIWVVTSERRQQIQRLMETRHLTESQAILRVDAQPPAEEKLARADIVIDNSGTQQCTWHQVLAAWGTIPSAPAAGPDNVWPQTSEEE